jgi:hypothetical protein
VRVRAPLVPLNNCTGGLVAKTPLPYSGDEGSTPSRCSEFFDNSASN